MRGRFSAEVCKDAFRRALSENEYTMQDKCYVEIDKWHEMSELRGFAATTNMERMMVIAFDLKGTYQFMETLELDSLKSVMIKSMHFGSYEVGFVYKAEDEYRKVRLIIHKNLYLTDLKNQKKNATRFLKRLGRYSMDGK